MANIRLALFLAVALVAVTAPVIESGLSIADAKLGWFKDIGELRNKLAMNILETKEIGNILKYLYSNDKDAKIGELKVIKIIDKEKRFSSRKSKKHLSIFSEQEHNIFEEKDCSRGAILAHFKHIMSSNLNTVLNVCKFVHLEWMSYCVDNIKQVHEDEPRLAKVGAKELAPEQVSEILDSIGDKKNAKFMQTSVESLLHQSPPFRVEDCLPDAIDARKSYLRHPNPILVSNLQNFDKALDLLFPFCAQNIRNVFESSTASITPEVQSRIKSALPSESAYDWLREGHHSSLDGRVANKIYEDEIENSCREVRKSVANVKYIKKRAKKSLSERLNKLLGREWAELDHDCFYYLECYVNYLEPKKSNFCDAKPNSVRFLQIIPGAVRWKYYEAENRAP